MIKSAALKIPQIEHPLSKLAKEQSKELVLNPFAGDNSDGRPIGFEDESKYKSRKVNGSKNSCRESRTDSIMDGVDLRGTFLTNVPENVKVIEVDPKCTKLPIFGNRTPIASRASTVSRISSSYENEKTNPLDVSDRFQKKILSNYYEIRKKFLDNDPENKGNVTREGLMRILQLTTGYQITKSCFNNLLQLWAMKTDKQMFSFAEINAIFMKRTKPENGSFIDPVHRHQSKPIEPSKISAMETLDILKEKFKSRELYLTDLFPEAIESQKYEFGRTELKNALYRIMIDLTSPEMDKLWLKFDSAKQGSINGMKFLKVIGIISLPTNSITPRMKAQSENHKSSLTTNSLESLLKIKLREGFSNLSRDFQAKDIYRTGYVSNDDFLQVLADNDLVLEKNLLTEFLTRCVIVPTKDGIPYQDFLIRFQDRSEAGVTHKLLMQNNKSKSIELESQTNPLTMVEMKLINLFQKDFLEILSSFRKADKFESGIVNIKDFRKIIERKLKIDFTEQQFKSVIDGLQLNQDLGVPYLDFLKQFDTGNFTPLLNENPTNSPLNKPEVDSSAVLISDETSEKSLNEIKNIIKNVVDTRYNDVDKAFRELDEYNSNSLTQETMYQLLRKINIKPELSRGDIRAVWKIFILNERQSLDFKEFVRHFVYRKSIASFPNAKLCPPVKGDADYMQRSRKLNAASDILLDNVRSKIDLFYHELVKEFKEIDKENTGEISLDYFQEILKELNIHLNDYEINKVCQKFSVGKNKIAYAQLLKPFSVYKQSKHRDESPGKSHTIPINNISKTSSNLDEEIKDISKKLQILTQSKIKRSIKRIDSNKTGTIPLTELRALLLLQGISLSEDEVYTLMSRYDSKLNGTLNYLQLLKEIDDDD